MTTVRNASRNTALTLTIMTVFLFSGCGAILNGSRQDITITSQPEGASVFINNQPLGETPVTARLKRSENYRILLELPGYQPYELQLGRKLSGVYWLNVLNVIGFIIDPLSGTMYRLDPEEVNAVFANQGMQLDETENGLYIGVLLNPDPSWEVVGHLTPALAPTH